MVDRGEVCVLLPTYDEAATVGGVVAAFRDRGFSNVLVVDGHSTDGTRESIFHPKPSCFARLGILLLP